MRAGSDGADPVPIVQYWHDGRPPDYIAELLDTFRDLNPEAPHLVFDASGAERLIAERLGAREAAAFRACAVPAMQADYFRYCAALVLGGLYCDADLRCIASLQPEMPDRGEGWLVVRPRGAFMNGLFAFGSPGHSLLELTVELATRNIERRMEDNVFMATGPALWATLYRALQMGSFEAVIENAPEPVWERYARSCHSVVGNVERWSGAFQGVAIRPVSDTGGFVQASGMRLAYKQSDMHWTNFRGGIYRDPSPGGAA